MSETRVEYHVSETRVEYFYERDTWIIVMEYCSGYVDLHHHMKKMAKPFNGVNAW